MPPLSDFLDNPEDGGNLSEQEKTFLELLPPLKYRDGRMFEGKPKTVVFSDPIRFYDEDGAQLFVDSALLAPARPLDDFSLVEPIREEITWNGMNIRYR